MGFFGGSGGGASASNMVGATSSVAGTAGLVPAPAAGDQERFLRGDATFSNDVFPNESVADFDTTAVYKATGSPANFANGFANVIYLLPIFISKRTAISTIAFRCTGHSVSGSPAVKALVYSHLNGLPYSLLYNSGAITIAQAAANYFHTVTGLTLDRGVYWIGLVRSNGSMGFLSIVTGTNPIMQYVFGGYLNTSLSNSPVGHDSSYTTPATTLPTKIRFEDIASTSTYLTVKATNETIWMGIR